MQSNPTNKNQTGDLCSESGSLSGDIVLFPCHVLPRRQTLKHAPDRRPESCSESGSRFSLGVKEGRIERGRKDLVTVYPLLQSDLDLTKEGQTDLDRRRVLDDSGDDTDEAEVLFVAGVVGLELRNWFGFGCWVWWGCWVVELA